MGTVCIMFLSSLSCIAGGGGLRRTQLAIGIPWASRGSSPGSKQVSMITRFAQHDNVGKFITCGPQCILHVIRNLEGCGEK